MRLSTLLVIIQCLDYIGRALGSNPRPQVLVDFIDHLAADEPVFRECGFFSMHFRSGGDAGLLDQVLKRLRQTGSR